MHDNVDTCHCSINILQGRATQCNSRQGHMCFVQALSAQTVLLLGLAVRLQTPRPHQQQQQQHQRPAEQQSGQRVPQCCFNYWLPANCILPLSALAPPAQVSQPGLVNNQRHTCSPASQLRLSLSCTMTPPLQPYLP
jgi:hypothetical protein